MELDIRTLQCVLNRSLDRLVENGHQRIDLDVDYYWDIPKEERYAVHNDPSLEQLTMGQLSEDWEFVMNIERDKSEPIAYSLVWLGALIRRIGEQIVG